MMMLLLPLFFAAFFPLAALAVCTNKNVDASTMNTEISSILKGNEASWLQIGSNTMDPKQAAQHGDLFVGTF